MYLVKIINVNGMTERRTNEKITVETSVEGCSRIIQKRNIPIGGIKDIYCNTKSNLLNIWFPISGLGEPNLYQN